MLGRGWGQWALALVVAAAGGASAFADALGWRYAWLAATLAVVVPALAVPAKVVDAHPYTTFSPH